MTSFMNYSLHHMTKGFFFSKSMSNIKDIKNTYIIYGICTRHKISERSDFVWLCSTKSVGGFFFVFF